jgi:hypothetical protein
MKNKEDINEKIRRELANGKDQDVPFTHDGLSFEIPCRPLTMGELDKLKEIELEGQKPRMNMVQKGSGRTKRERKEQIRNQVQNFEQIIDLQQLKSKERLVKITAIQWCTGITPDTFADLSTAFNLRDALWDHIVKISNLHDDDLNIISEFREDEPGKDDGKSGIQRDAISADPAGTDS